MTDSPTLPQIDKIVVLMLENRSLDNVLGWLHSDGKPVRLYPEGTMPRHFDGVPSSALNTGSGGWPYRPSHGFAALGEDRWRVPRWDPNEGIIDVHRQMYGNLSGAFGDTWPDDAPMDGFVRDFSSVAGESVGEVMGAYTTEELPVLYGLAENFAVSDRWFGSMPTETDPNRAFSLTGAAEGAEYELPPKSFAGPTLFNGLNPDSSGSREGRSWAIYYRAEGAASFAPSGSCYTVGRFKGVQDALKAPASRGSVDRYDKFLTALRNDDDIADFCYLEPYWSWGVGYADGSDFAGMQGTDYHPPAWTGPGEWALNELYVALRASRHWEHMLFVVVFDEHGGCYDHVAPTRASNPHGRDASWPVPFDYSRMGPRVPAVLVSPFVYPRTVFRAPLHSGASFDHTSLLKTILRWGGCDETFITSLGKRVAAAPMFDGVLSPTIVQQGAVRDFHPPISFQNQCPLGARNLPFSADGLDRAASDRAAASSSTVAEYLAALAEERP